MRAAGAAGDALDSLCLFLSLCLCPFLSLSLSLSLYLSTLACPTTAGAGGDTAHFGFRQLLPHNARLVNPSCICLRCKSPSAKTTFSQNFVIKLYKPPLPPFLNHLRVQEVRG